MPPKEQPDGMTAFTPLIPLVTSRDPAVNQPSEPSFDIKIEGAVDCSDSERGTELLSQLDELTLVVMHPSENASEFFAETVARTAVNQLERAGISVEPAEVQDLSNVDFSSPVLIMAYEFCSPNRFEESDGQHVWMHIVLAVEDADAAGETQAAFSGSPRS